ncbi:hypothetical protein Rs2_38486 [Raphanus sativus]|nr:hypothetical protein Rs2_38486 [Raphanus sativus]
MGGLCSRSSSVNNAPGGSFTHVNEEDDPCPLMMVNEEAHPSESFSFPNLTMSASVGSHPQNIKDGIPQLPRVLSHKSRSTKSRQAVSSLLGRAGTMGLGKAVDVLDTLGSSMTNLNHSGGGFSSATTTKGNKISILSLEVASTIVKGANLMHSLSKQSIAYLKELVLLSQGVHNLVSKDMDQLLRIAAADKSEELRIFSGEVVCLGNHCKDHQYHNLDHFFDRLGSEFTPQQHLKQEAESIMHQLMTFVHFTAELYHELHSLDRFEQDYQRKIQEEANPNTAQRGTVPNQS